LNVAFHALAALAIGQTAACRTAPSQRPAPGGDVVLDSERRVSRRFWIAAVVFVLGVMSHGVLDGLPHEYAFKWLGDTIASATLVGVWLAITKPGYRSLLLIAIAGAVLPDVIDHVPRDINRHLGTHLPELRKLFPWHHRGGSGSLSGVVPFDAHVASIANHVIVVSFCAAALWLSRGTLRRIR
jgi:hypothetical protein